MTEIGRIMFQHRGQRCSNPLPGLSAPRSATQMRDYCCSSVNRPHPVEYLLPSRNNVFSLSFCFVNRDGVPAAPPRHLLISLSSVQRTRLINRSFNSQGNFNPTLSEEEDRFPGVHAGERHDVKVREPSFVRIGDGQQVLQVPDLGVDLVPSSLGCAFG